MLGGFLSGFSGQSNVDMTCHLLALRG